MDTTDGEPISANADAEWFHRQGFISSSREVSSGSTVHFHANFTIPPPEKPILVLLHGYPQTSFLWRYAANFMDKGTPMFIPDLPGYGRSTPAYRHDKRIIGESVTEALAEYIQSFTFDTPGVPPPTAHRIILVGHDRGARVAHRLAVDMSNGVLVQHGVATYDLFHLVGLVIMDTLPTAEQWKVFGSSAKGAERSFHWGLLANVELATGMIRAYGGGRWCSDMMKRWAGTDEEGRMSLWRGGAVEIYAGFFERESVVRATCEDYRAGANEDVTAQEEDQHEGRKIKVSTLVLYSADYLGKAVGDQMGAIWRNWVSDPEKLEVQTIHRSGHFIAEEQPRQTYEAVKRFYERHQREEGVHEDQPELVAVDDHGLQSLDENAD